jgi:phosphoribosylformylglycinamidine synthase subunit PurQ / glutaminase
MRAAVLLFPGSNADVEMIRTLRDVMGVTTDVVWHRQHDLPPVDLVAIPGGFSYGDYLRTGAIAATSPIVGAVRRHAEAGGYVLGVCNGFQILCETRLLPGALVRNAHLRFECRDVHVRSEVAGPFTPAVGRVLRLPVAHAEGRYHADESTLDGLARADRIALTYCRADGTSGDDANLNGSVRSIAGIYGGPRRNVLGLMPHPERMSESLHGGTDGRVLFECVVEAIAKASAPTQGLGAAP